MVWTKGGTKGTKTWNNLTWFWDNSNDDRTKGQGCHVDSYRWPLEVTIGPSVTAGPVVANDTTKKGQTTQENTNAQHGSDYFRRAFKQKISEKKMGLKGDEA